MQDMFVDNRTDSPDSLPPVSRHSVASHLHSTARPLTYAEVVQGISFKTKSELILGLTLLGSGDVSPPFQSGEQSSPQFLDDWLSESGRHSPDSVRSCSEFRPMSPDSPVPQFRCPYIDCSVELSESRSYTPESTSSDWEGTDLCLEDLFENNRPESPRSVVSDFEPNKLFSIKTLSPDSLSVDFDFSLLNDWHGGCKASSPESVVSVDDHNSSHVLTFGQIHDQHCNYYLQYSVNRPISSLSTVSDAEDIDFCMQDMFFENRTDSPDSLPPVSRHSVASPHLHSTARPLTYAEVIRGISFKTQSEPILGLTLLGSGDVSPPFQSEEQSSPQFLDDWLTESGRHSPDSVRSCSEFRPMSPDSPVPQFRCPYIDCSVELSESRSYTPESTSSDWEGTDLCLEGLFENNRPESPRSVVSDFEPNKLFSIKTLSPDSLSVDFDFSLLKDWHGGCKASSPESVVSVDYQNSSHVLTFGQLHVQHCNYYLQYSVSKPLSPLSTVSNAEDIDFCMQDMFVDSRTDSPDSLPPVSRHSVASHLHSTARPLTDAEVVQGISFKTQSEPILGLTLLGSGDVSPPFQSEEQSSPQFLDDWLSQSGRHSPDSVRSCSEFRPMSPDSPVPQFRCPYIDCSVELSESRSYTPESTSSDWEGTDLCLEGLFENNRPESPRSVVSDFEPNKLFSIKTLSPDSLSVDFDFSLLNDWHGGCKASSPESVVSVDYQNSSHVLTFGQLHDQHCNYYLQYSIIRPISPLSTVSNAEDIDFCMQDMFVDNRTDSPNSLPPVSRHSVASHLHSTARPLTYAEVVRGISFKTQSEPILGLTLLGSGDVSPLFQSEEQSSPQFLDDCLSESGRHSPDSVRSCSEFRPMSPDSPVPQFRCPYIDCSVELSESRSYTPESTLSDWEGTDLCLEGLFENNRPESPRSVVSDFEPNKSLNSNTLLSDLLPTQLNHTGVMRTSSPLLNTTRPQTFAIVFHENNIEMPAFLFVNHESSMHNALSIDSAFLPYNNSGFLQQSHMKSNSLLISKLHDPFYKGQCFNCLFRLSKSQ
ncbi:uncharacterized protein LOC124868440 [Girardinichthys multiradiatus]|uniref:uncharacterized protein LOC124868440 n=1 Tax=Girardinichthys multiradiatus TaxID=208333 RepID=UPI001FADA8E6|nr:uncharacterized protein LOC124868440 [Girardinichthys multiradiatus]XP_047221667.1 uncharacterized protein LOC124868440 [Girardinichthys multiradiatus]